MRLHAKHLLIVFFTICTQAAYAITIKTVEIGNPDNAPDNEVMLFDGTSGYGSVDYTFRIATTEITNSQYVEFLNAVAADDPYSLYDTTVESIHFEPLNGVARSGASGNYSYSVKPPVPGEGPNGSAFQYEDKPVIGVTWFDAIRFTNWLHNGQGSGDTETGAYTLIGGTPIPSNADSITRNPEAKWFLPSEDEWYKAAYFNGSTNTYFDYATGSDVFPDSNLPSGDTGNSYNTTPPINDLFYHATDVGAYTLSSSPYGTYDQEGNAVEWTETLNGTSRRIFRGTNRVSGIAGPLAGATIRFDDSPDDTDSIRGFRVASASIPEPSSLILCCFATMCVLTTISSRHHRQHEFASSFRTDAHQ